MASTKRVKLPSWGGGLSAWQAEAELYRSISPDVVTAAAESAGAKIQVACQDIIFTSPDLGTYQDVAESTTVWSDEENVYIGVKPGDPVRDRADHMNEDVYPVMETAFDMAGADAKQTFEQELLLL